MEEVKNNKNIYYVYEWIRLDTNEPFYIGKGKGYRCYRRKRSNNHFNNIVKSIPTIVHILQANLNEKEAFEYECWYINEYKYVIGYNLVNITDGGEGISGYKQSEKEVKMNRMRIHGFDIEDYKDEIIYLYTKKNMSGENISKIYGVSDVCVINLLKRFKVKIRKQKETILLNRKVGIDLYNSKCVLVKDLNKNIINCFETRIDCGKWMVDIGLVKKYKGGTKAILKYIDSNKNYKGLLFYSVTHDEFKKVNKNNFKNFKVNNINIQSPTYATIIEVFNINNTKIKTFMSLLDCANWLIDIGLSKSFSAGRDGIYRNANNGKFYKHKYTFKQYSKEEYLKIS